MKGHHEKLKKLLEAQNKVEEINEHRDPIENECPKEDEHDAGGLDYRCTDYQFSRYIGRRYGTFYQYQYR